MCVRTRETDGEDARTRRDDAVPDDDDDTEMEMKWVSVEVSLPPDRKRIHFLFVRRRGSVVRSRGIPFVTITGCKIYDDRA